MIYTKDSRLIDERIIQLIEIKQAEISNHIQLIKNIGEIYGTKSNVVIEEEKRQSLLECQLNKLQYILEGNRLKTHNKK